MHGTKTKYIQCQWLLHLVLWKEYLPVGEVVHDDNDGDDETDLAYCVDDWK